MKKANRVEIKGESVRVGRSMLVLKPKEHALDTLFTSSRSNSFPAALSILLFTLNTLAAIQIKHAPTRWTLIHRRKSNVGNPIPPKGSGGTSEGRCERTTVNCATLSRGFEAVNESRESTTARENTFSVMLKTDFGQLETGSPGLKSTPGRLNSKAGTLETEAGRLNSKAGTLETEAGRFKSKAGTLETGAGRFKANSARLETGAGRLKSKARTLETGAGRLKTKAGTLETETGRLKSKAGRLETETGRFKSKAGRLKAESGRFEINPSELGKNPETPIISGESLEYRQVNIGRHTQAVRRGNVIVERRMGVLGRRPDFRKQKSYGSRGIYMGV